MLILMIATSCERNANVNLGCKYRLINSASFRDLTIIKEHNIVVIDGHILDYSFDSIFILVAQCPRDSISGIETMTQQKYQEAFEQNTFRQYWIIDKEKKSIFDEKKRIYSNVYGPYNMDGYITKKKELGVRDNLRLKTE